MMRRRILFLMQSILDSHSSPLNFSGSPLSFFPCDSSSTSSPTAVHAFIRLAIGHGSTLLRIQIVSYVSR